MPHQWNYLWKLSWMLNYENVSINLYINLSEVIKQDLLWFDSIWFSRIDTVLYNSILFDYRMKSIDIHKSRLLPPSFLVNNNSIDWGCWIKLSTTYPISRLLHILEVIASYQQHILYHVFFISWSQQQQTRLGLLYNLSTTYNIIWSPYKMIADKMNFVHNDRLRTVQDDIQTVKIDIQ